MPMQPFASFQQDHHPISRLPPELLSHVFWISLQSTIIPLHYHNLMLLRLVCKEWNRLIERSPAFWSVLDTAQTLRTTERILSRSGAYPLTLWTSEYGRRRHFHKTHETVLRKCLEELGRCISLSLNIPMKYCKRPLTGLLAQPTPLLRSLSIELRNFSDDHVLESDIEAVALFGDHISRLEDIALEFVKVNWNWPTLSTLRTLFLKYVRITIPELVNVLAASPALETLRLKGIRADDIAGSYSPPAKLHSLIKLYIVENDEKSVKQFLERVIAPSCTRLVVSRPSRSRIDPAEDAQLLSDFLLENLSTVFPSIVPIGKPISYLCSHFSLACSLEEEEKYDPRVDPDTREIGPFRLDIHEASRAWPFALEFHQRYTEGQPCSITDYLSPILPHIEILFQLDMTTTFRLHCNRSPEEIDTLFDYFGRPHSFPSTQAPRWLFPKLQTLVLDYPRDMDAVAAMVKRRYGADASVHDVEMPTRLEKLQIEVIESDVKNLDSGIAELEAFLGKEVVSCDI